MLGERWVTKKSGRQAGQLVRKEDELVYIPILETIQVLLNNVSVSTEVIHFMLIWVISGDHCVQIHDCLKLSIMPYSMKFCVHWQSHKIKIH